MGVLVPELRMKPELPSLKEIGRRAAQLAEREAIARTLRLTGGNKSQAARALKISYRAMLYKIKQAGLAGVVRLEKEDHNPWSLR